MAVAEKKKVLFGPFELDTWSAELTRDGTRLKLQPQPIQVLTLLLEHPGELVTREEFRQRLWPVDTFVDFEHGLNTAIKKLRQALGDEAETPRYIETLPRRGYRFIGSVQTSMPKTILEFPPVIENSIPPQSAITDSIDEKSRVEVTNLSGRSKWYVVGALLFTSIAVLLYFSWPRIPYVKRTHQLTSTGRHKSPIGPRTVVTDGTRVFFAEHWRDKWYIAQVAVAGGEASSIDTPQIQNPHIFDISRDGSELLVGEWSLVTYPLWIVPLPAGPAHRVGNIEALSAKLTPDGKHILFSTDEDKRMFIADRDGSNVRALFTAPDKFGSITISPDGKLIRFSSGVGIWESKIDGSGLHRFMPELGWTCCGSWSADGSIYVFSRFDELGPMVNLWAVDEGFRWPWRRTPKLTQLTFGPMPFLAPTFNKDTKQLLLLGQVMKGELLVYDQTTQIFSPYLSGISAGNVDFTRDGQWVTYVTYPEGELWRSRIDGTQRTKLTYPPIRPVANPKWSPDGRLIVFEARGGSGKRIYAVPATGGSPMLLLDGVGNPMDPTWSADSNSIVYSDDPSAQQKGMVRILSIKEQQSNPIPGSEGLFAPRWSPDGEHILALSFDAKRLMIYSVQKKRWRLLYMSEEIGFPSWSHDSRYIFVSRGITTERGEIEKIRLADGHVEVVADSRSIETTSIDGLFSSWFALTPDDRIIMMRDRGTDEVYALDLAFR